MMLGKNDPLPMEYRDFPFQYTQTQFGIVLRKNDDEVFLQDGDEAVFMRDCNRAKQKGRNISDVIDEYFINMEFWTMPKTPYLPEPSLFVPYTIQVPLSIPFPVTAVLPISRHKSITRLF
jgi:hypothetical protein